MNEKRTERIVLQVTPSQKKAWEEAAKEQGLSLSSFGRKAIITYITMLNVKKATTRKEIVKELKDREKLVEKP